VNLTCTRMRMRNSFDVAMRSDDARGKSHKNPISGWLCISIPAFASSTQQRQSHFAHRELPIGLKTCSRPSRLVMDDCQRTRQKIVGQPCQPYHTTPRSWKIKRNTKNSRRPPPFPITPVSRWRIRTATPASRCGNCACPVSFQSRPQPLLSTTVPAPADCSDGIQCERFKVVGWWRQPR
jgi:hypothetical protein